MKRAATEHQRRCRLLAACGIIVAEVALPAIRSPDLGGNLLPWLSRRWQDSLGHAGRRNSERRVTRWVDAAEQYAENDCRLTWGFPAATADESAQWLGDRLVWWTQPPPSGSSVAVVSSRLGRPLDLRRRWFAALRAACRSVDPCFEYLMTADKTAADRFVVRAAALYDLPLVRVHLPPRRQSVATWLEQMLAGHWTSQVRAVSTICHTWLSPPLADDPMAQLPVQDRLLVGNAARLFVCHVRPHGAVQELVQKRLANSAMQKQCVTLAVGVGRTEEPTVRRLVRSGADPLCIAVAARSTARASAAPQHPLPPGATAPIVPLDQWLQSRPYLIHCTRHQIAPWPDQDEEEFFEDLIMDLPAADHSALATLQRILETRRLCATNRTIRGGYQVVSLSRVPLHRLPKLRVYRPHRTRWDFQPYGVGIDLAWLARRGARPVRYGDQTTWQRLSSAERPFFQLARGRASAGIDWTVEREWRHLGDVSLAALNPDEAFVFVPTLAAARQLRTVSRWPIVVVASAANP